jgi:hypothetical protein
MKHMQLLGRSIGLTFHELLAKLQPIAEAWNPAPPGMEAGHPTAARLPLMSAAHFTERRLAEIYGGSALTADERAFLLADTPNFEESHASRATLASMSDIDLLREARRAWLDWEAHT